MTAARKLISAGRHIFTDDFNRANSATLGSNWTNTSSGLQIVSNEAVGLGSGATVNEARCEIDLGSSDMVVVATFDRNGATSADDSVRLTARWDDSARTHYGFTARCETFGFVQLWKRVAGAFTSLNGFTEDQLQDGDVLRLEVVGTSLAGYINDVLKISTTNSDITTGTKAGITTSGAVVTADNFEARPL